MKKFISALLVISSVSVSAQAGDCKTPQGGIENRRTGDRITLLCANDDCSLLNYVKYNPKAPETFEYVNRTKSYTPEQITHENSAYLLNAMKNPFTPFPLLTGLSHGFDGTVIIVGSDGRRHREYHDRDGGRRGDAHGDDGANIFAEAIAVIVVAIVAADTLDLIVEGGGDLIGNAVRASKMKSINANSCNPEKVVKLRNRKFNEFEAALGAL